ncbi:MAG: pilus assembly protein CpaF [Mariniblastus sp.]|jgi:pilus assembly protein CpaF
MSRQAVFEASLRYFLTPIGRFLDDPTVTEVMVNGHRQIFIERKGQIESTDAQFLSEDALRSAVNNLAQSVGREINERHPVLDARLPDGSRVHAIIPPSARSGTCITIRKFSREPLTLHDLLKFGSLTESAIEFLEICIRLRKNVIISGGSGTGKTSMLGALSDAIPETERIIVIEDTSELRLHQNHCLYLEAQPATKKLQSALSIRELFRSSLRMRPDRIIVGEVRGGEALDLIQSMISGHEGSLSTVHASSAIDALVRLETLSLMSDVEIPVYVARAQVASAIDVVVQLTRSNENGRRRVSSITEAGRLSADQQYQLSELYSLRPRKIAKGKQGNNPDSKDDLELHLTATGNLPSFSQQPFENGMDARIQVSQDLWSKPSIANE